jgi:GNAT superfamily N-acetyltransferase
MQVGGDIGPLRADEVDAVVELCRAFCAEDRHPFDADRVRAGLVGLLERPHFGTTLVLRQGPTPVGYAVVTLGWSLESGGLDALLDEVYVTPDRRGGGVGTALITAALDHARALGARRAYLEVEASNPAARRLYRRLGFVAEDSQMMLRWFDGPPA